MRWTAISSTATVICVLALVALAGQNPRDIYQRARMLDQSGQNPTEAIRLYSQVVSLSRDNRALAAHAQYRIGVLYNRMRKTKEAQQAFNSVISRYPDQTEVANQARTRIKTVANGRNSNSLEIKRTDRSPDNRLLAAFTFPPHVSLSRPVIDEQRHRLYVITKPQTALHEHKKLPPNTREVGGIVYWPSTLVVIDTRTLAVVKTVPFPVHLSGIAVSPVNDKLYLSEFIDGHVRVIDPATFATLARFPVPGYPMGPHFDPATKKIYLASQGFPGNDPLSIIDPHTNSIAQTIGIGGSAGAVVINPATNRIYVWRNEGTRTLSGEDGSTIADLPEMQVLSVNPVSNRLYAQNTVSPERPSVHVLDAITHDILATLRYKGVPVSGTDTDSRANRTYLAMVDLNQIAVIDAITYGELNRIEITYPESLTADRQTGNVYVIHSSAPLIWTLSVLSKEAMEEKVPQEFFDDFDGPQLDPEWIATDKSSYSLTQNPGYLRYSISGPTGGRPRLVMARKFRGEDWIFEMKVSYFMSATGGGRGPHFLISFDEPRLLTGLFSLGNGIHLSSYRGDWDGSGHGVISAYFAEKGAPFSYIRERPNPADTYYYRIKRAGRTVTIERSDDGSDFTLIASRTFEEQIDGHTQHVVFGYNSYGANDGYVDIDFVRLTRLSPQSRR